MERFVEGGVYNLVLLNLAPTGPLYGADPDEPRFFSEEWWHILDQVCAHALKLGISLWVYDQIGFSGANIQGEIVREQPEYAGQWLESVCVEGEGTLEAMCPAHGVPIAAGVVPVDDDGRATGPVVEAPIVDRVARWEGVGRHRLRMAYWVEKGFDYFSPDACRRLLDVIHGAYEARVGKYFGKVIVGSFQDELPSLPTWGRDFPEQFARRWGYRIEPHLVGLWESDDETSRKARVHYHRLRAELAEEAFFKPLFDWHQRHGLICGFDQQSPSRAGEPMGAVRQYADYMATHRWYQAPGSDHHGDAKIHSSLAHLYGRRRVWIEAFHSSGWGGTIEETLDWLLPWLRAGATLYNPHAVYYSTRGGWWESAPPSTCWRQPYWRHYAQFAHAISRLCGILSEGAHVADIGVLFPTTTVQAGLTPDGATAAAERVEKTYLQLVGVMHWQRTRPGVMDQDRRDYDILDEASVTRADVREGALVAGGERFKVVITPACSVMDAPVARALLRFVDQGGRWIAIATLPEQILGEEAGELLEAIRRAHQAGKVHLIAEASELPAVLADHARIVDAPWPTLLRRVGDAHVLFVTAAFPNATKHHRPHGQAVHYEFDPSSYARSVRVTVHGVKGQPELWDVTTGERRPLTAVWNGESCQVDVPFESGPAALVVWPGKAPLEAAEPGSAAAADEVELYTFGDRWAAQVEPTLDNRFGDFSKPDTQGPFPLETWFFEHTTAAPEEDTALRERAGAENARWRRVQATFGVYGRWIGPAEKLPAPAEITPSDAGGPYQWKEAVYSLTRGIADDPLHYHTLGPKGHVPEEFCRFGRVRKGEAVQYHTRVFWDGATSGEPVYLALAAPVAKEI